MLILDQLRHLRSNVHLWSPVLIAAAACGRQVSDEPSGSGTANPSVYAAGICNYMARCTPSLVRGQFGDVATCVATFSAAASKLLHANGTSITRLQLNACVVKTESASCDDDIESLGECDFTGTLSDGAPCSSGVQCRTGSCFKPLMGGVMADCGVCSPRLYAQADCSTAACAPGLDCIDNECIAPSSEGGPCGDVARVRCRGSLACVNGACAAPRQRGESCTVAMDDVPCDAAQGLTCVDGTCTALLATAGASCERTSFCEASYCGEGKHCLAYGGEGAACAPESPCAFPLECKDGSCSASDLSACR